MLLSKLDMLELWMSGRLHRWKAEELVDDLGEAIVELIRTARKICLEDDNASLYSPKLKLGLAAVAFEATVEFEHHDLDHRFRPPTPRGEEIIQALVKEKELKESDEFRVNPEEPGDE